jgi:hypothetical protein
LVFPIIEQHTGLSHSEIVSAAIREFAKRLGVLIQKCSTAAIGRLVRALVFRPTDKWFHTIDIIKALKAVPSNRIDE